MPKRVKDAILASPAATFAAAKDTARARAKTWSAAVHAPLICKIGKKSFTNAKGKTRNKPTYRTKRLIGSHAFNVAASGAALHAKAVLDDEAQMFVVKMWRLIIYETEAKKQGLARV